MKYFTLLLILIPGLVLATDRYPRADAVAETASEATSSIGDINAPTSIEVDAPYQAPSTYVGASTNTAPCYYSNGFSLGVPGIGGGRHKSRRDEDCWVLHEEMTRNDNQRKDREMGLREREMDLAERAMILRESEHQRLLRIQDECFQDCQEK